MTDPTPQPRPNDPPGPPPHPAIRNVITVAVYAAGVALLAGPSVIGALR